MGGQVKTPKISQGTSGLEIELKYRPLPKQAEFHADPAKYRFFGGGWGNGKTSAGCAEALTLALEYPGSVGLIARRTRQELKATTQHTFFSGGGGNPATDFSGCPRALIKSFNKTEQRLSLINGSIIHFWPLDDPDKLSNLNLGWFLIDQAEEVPESMFQMLEGRLRQVNAPRKGMVLFNPNGHDWIWRRCISLKSHQHSLIHAKTTDNPNLPADYIASLMNMPEAWRKRFMEGSFDVFSGQIWPEFDPEIHLIQPFVIPEWYTVVESIDHGRRNPTAVCWVTYANIGGWNYAFVVDEHYEAGQLVGYHAQKILDHRDTWGMPEYTVIDASAAAQDPNTGRSVIDEYMDYGILPVPSDRHVIARINRVGEWLQPHDHRPHPLTGKLREGGWPALFFFKSLIELPEHIQQYQWKKKPPTQEADAREEPLKRDDHDVDSLGYNLMTRPVPGVAPVDVVEKPNSRYWELHRRRIEGARDRGPAHDLLGSEA